MSLLTKLIEYLILSIFIAPFSLKFARMDKRGSLAAFFIGLIVYTTLGFSGFIVLLSLHIIGAVVTRIGYEKKVSRGIAQKIRSLDNVLANGFFPAMAALLSSYISNLSLPLYVAYHSTIAAATADTVSSEIGELSNKNPVLITTFEEVEVGTDGAVSLLGTLSGLASAGLIASIAFLLNNLGSNSLGIFATVTVAGFIGTTADSFLGATLERSGKIGNDLVNLISIGISFFAALSFYMIF